MLSEKMLPAPGSRSTPLLPSLRDAQKLLGFTISFAKTLEQLSTQSETDLPVKRATLYKFNNIDGIQGVSSQSRNKVADFLQEVMSKTHSPDLQLPDDEEYTGGAAETGWNGLITALKHPRNSINEWEYLVDFIAQRINFERVLLNKIPLSSSPQHHVFDDYLVDLKNQTLIPEKALRCVKLILNNQRNLYSEDDIVLWHCSSKLDFYFSAVDLSPEITPYFQ